MIDKDKIRKLLENELKNSSYFLVDVEVSPKNIISIFVDGDSGIPIHECVRISRLIENKYNRDQEDYELRVSSPGLDKPFIQLRQYRKYVGRAIQLVKTNDEPVQGKLLNFNDTSIDIEISEGKKKKTVKTIHVPFEEIKEARPVIGFK